MFRTAAGKEAQNIVRRPTELGKQLKAEEQEGESVETLVQA